MEWIGVPERCDRCGKWYPMAWIIFTGTQFLCYACFYERDPDQHPD